MTLRYLFVTVKHGHFTHIIREETTRPSSYQWYKAFQEYPKATGEIRYVQDIANTDFEKYSVVHVNISTPALQVIQQIRELLGKASSTLLISNLDYNVTHVDEAFKLRMHEFFAALNACDFCFAQEPFQLQFLNLVWKEVLRRKTTIPLIPHPADTDGLKKLYVPPDERTDRVITMFHRYDGQLLIPSIIARGGTSRTRGKFAGLNVEVPTHLFGYPDNISDLMFFDETSRYGDWDKFIYTLAQSTIALSYYTVHSQDRFLAETACLGVPAVSTSFSYFGTKFYPRTCYPPWELEKMLKAVEQLKTDNQFWTYVKDYAWKAVEEINSRNSVEKLLKEMRNWELKV